MKALFGLLYDFTKKSDHLALPLLRLLLAYGFFKPALMKWKDINAIGSWFEIMGYPFPLSTCIIHVISFVQMQGV